MEESGRGYNLVYCCFILIVITVWLAPLIVWLVVLVGPGKDEDRILPEFVVNSVSATPLNVSSQLVTGHWNVSFLVRNRFEDDTSIYYDQTQALLLYKGVLLSNTTLDSFYQGRRTDPPTVVEARFSGAAVNVDKWVSDAMMAEKTNGGALDFKVYVVLEGMVCFWYWNAVESSEVPDGPL